MPVNEALLHNWFYGNYGVRVAASIVFAYLLGSIPIAGVVRWLFADVDPRFGRIANAAVPVADALKNFVATIIPLHGGGAAIGLTSAFAATIGHYFTPWQRMQGDWRIGAFLGALFALSAPSALIVLVFCVVSSIAGGSFEYGTIFAAALAFWPLWFFLGAPSALLGIAAGTVVGLRLRGSGQVLEGLDV